MSSKGDQEFVHRLEALKGGDKGLLRGLRGSRLDDRLRGFDLFTGIWWTIRQKNAGAPRREPAWLVVKLFSCNPIPSADGEAFPVLLARLSKTDSSVQREFDAMIGLSLDLLEHPLHRLLARLRSHGVAGLDWAELTDDLSFWNDGLTRHRWMSKYMNNINENNHGGVSC